MTTKYLLSIALAVSCTYASKPPRHPKKVTFDCSPSSSGLNRSPRSTLPCQSTRSDLWQPSLSGLNRPPSSSVTHNIKISSVARELSSPAASASSSSAGVRVPTSVVVAAAPSSMESSTRSAEMDRRMALVLEDPFMKRLISSLNPPSTGEPLIHFPGNYHLAARAMRNYDILVSLPLTDAFIRKTLLERLDNAQVDAIMEEKDKVFDARTFYFTGYTRESLLSGAYLQQEPAVTGGTMRDQCSVM